MVTKESATKKIEKRFPGITKEYEILSYTPAEKTLFLHKKCGSEFYMMFYDFLQGHRCPNCASNSRTRKSKYDIETYKKEIAELYGDEYSVLSESLEKLSDKIKIRHNICGNEYIAEARNLLKRKMGCRNCAVKKTTASNRGSKRKPNPRRKTHEKFLEEVYDIFGDEYKVISEYKDNKTKILMEHSCGAQYFVSPNLLLSHKTTCPICAGKSVDPITKTVKGWKKHRNSKEMKFGNYIIYKYESSKAPGKVYIGQTMQTLKQRAGKNGRKYCEKRDGVYVQPKFANAIKLFGWNSFSAEILAAASSSTEADLLEQSFIEKFDSINNGYNIQEGGQINKNAGKRTIQFSLDNNDIIKIFNSVPEAAASFNGNPDNIRKCCTGRTKSSFGFFWMYEEDYLKYGLQRQANKRDRCVEQIDIFTGKVVNTWPTISQAEQETGINGARITSCCKKVRGVLSAGGFLWRYKEDNLK